MSYVKGISRVHNFHTLELLRLKRVQVNKKIFLIGVQEQQRTATGASHLAQFRTRPNRAQGLLGLPMPYMWLGRASAQGYSFSTTNSGKAL